MTSPGCAAEMPTAAYASNRVPDSLGGSERLGKALPDQAVVLGIPACSLNLRNTIRCIPTFDDFANGRESVTRYQAEFALVEEANANDYTVKHYRTLLSRSTRMMTLSLGPRQMTLFRLQSAR
jgi:hypothetical protein